MPSLFQQPPNASLTLWQETLVLDAIDQQLTSCGTISELRLNRLPESMCKRCRIAIRCTIEAFLESSSLKHAGIDAPAWFRGLRFYPDSSTEQVLDNVMWHAALFDNAGLRISAVPPLSSAERGLGEEDATRYVMLLLFVLARSTLKEHANLAVVRQRLASHFLTNEWWSSLWEHVRARMEAEQVGGPQRGGWHSAVRDTVTSEIREHVRLLFNSSTPAPNHTDRVDFTTCSDESCYFCNCRTCIHLTSAWGPLPPRSGADGAGQ